MIYSTPLQRSGAIISNGPASAPCVAVIEQTTNVKGADMVKKRSFWQEFLVIGIPAGFIMALLWWGLGGILDAPTSILFLVSFGLLSAMVIGLLATIYERLRWWHLESTEQPILRRSEKIVFMTPAYHGRNSSINGWLALTNIGLLFTVRSPNYRDLRIPFSSITAVREWRPVGSSGTGLEIELINGHTEEFEMEDIEPWRRLFAVNWTNSSRDEYRRNPLEEHVHI